MINDKPSRNVSSSFYSAFVGLLAVREQLLLSKPLNEEHALSGPNKEILLLQRPKTRKAFLYPTQRRTSILSGNHGGSSKDLLFFHSIKEFSFSRPIKKVLLFSRPIKEELIFPIVQSKLKGLPFSPSTPRISSAVSREVSDTVSFTAFLPFQLPAVVGTSCHWASSIIKSLVLIHPYFSCTTSIPTITKESCMKNCKVRISGSQE